jgi:hypothetical protein
MSRQPYREIPRWQRARQQKARQVVLSKRDGKRLVSQIAAQAAASPEPEAGTFHRPAFRFRRQLIPVWWLAACAVLGPGLHLLHRGRPGVLAGLILAAGIWLASRHRKGTDRSLRTWMAGLTALWVPVLAMTGTAKPWPAIAFGCWAVLMACWCKYYRVRPGDIPDIAGEEPAAQDGDQQTWERLAAKRKWSGRLANQRKIPGGRQWDIVLNGSDTDIGEVMAQPRKIAAAWGKSTAEAFAEPAPDGVESRGVLTILRKGTLAVTREWDGEGVDPATGIARIGRYADGQPASIRFFAPMDGAKHGLISGTSGSGKSWLLDLIVRACLTCGFIVPVILDPQEGQSLPQWRGHVPYASGADECMAMLRGLRAGMLDRSRFLSSFTWTDEDGHRVRGMDFFDASLCGLPLVMIIGDEYPVLLRDKLHGAEAIDITADIGKRGRKTGVALWPVAQVPSLTELGDQVVRSMLVGGSVVCLRTGDRVSAGMLGLLSDPSALPRYFGDGSPTYGLGYVLGPEMRQAAARIDLVPKAVRRTVPAVPDLDDRFAAAMGAATAFAGSQPELPAAPRALAPVPDDDEPVTEGRSCADAILAVLTREMTKGEIMAAAKAVTGGWGRKPFSARAFSDAINSLADGGRIRKEKHNTYAPARHLTVVGGSGGSAS